MPEKIVQISAFEYMSALVEMRLPKLIAAAGIDPRNCDIAHHPENNTYHIRGMAIYQGEPNLYIDNLEELPPRNSNDEIEIQEDPINITLHKADTKDGIPEDSECDELPDQMEFFKRRERNL